MRKIEKISVDDKDYRLLRIFFEQSYEQYITNSSPFGENQKETDGKVTDEKVKEYFSKIIAIPYTKFVCFATQNQRIRQYDVEDIPQHSNLDSASIVFCRKYAENQFKVLPSNSEIGALVLPTGTDTVGARSKFGETCAKLACMYGFATVRADSCYEITCVGRIAATSNDEEIKKFRVRAILRNPFFAILIKDLLRKDISIPDYLSKCLTGSTIARRTSNVKNVIEEIVNACKIEGLNIKRIAETDNAESRLGSFDSVDMKYRPYITAIKSKPFILLAGISGTGKSRIVRELARACWDKDSEEFKAHKPSNFEMVQVKPNWHDSSELIGYVSRVNGVHYVVGPFLKFMVKAMQNPDVPYFFCLDEMNLAPVEQYFAEYLSVIESRKLNEDDGSVVTDPIVDYSNTQEYFSLIQQLFSNDDLRSKYLAEDLGERLRIPQNLIVVGTVNMDETTFSFSRKVLDRAMTIEMNEVDLEGGLTERHEKIGKLSNAELVGTAVEGVDVYEAYQNVCETAIQYLQSINNKLEGTPFKVAYRTRNEVLLYVVNNLPYNKRANGDEIPREQVIARALDEVTSMKVLSRIEGDETKVSRKFLTDLKKIIQDGLTKISGLEYTDDPNEEGKVLSVATAKLKEMDIRLESGYTSFWN